MSIFQFPKYFLEFFIKVFFWDFCEKKYFCEHNYFFSEKFVSIIFFEENGTEEKARIFRGIRSWGFFVNQSNPFPHFWLTKKPQLFLMFFLFLYFLGFFEKFTVNFFGKRSKFFWVFFAIFIFLGFWAFLKNLQ